MMSAMLSLDLSDATTTADGFVGWLSSDGLRILVTVIGAVVLRWLLHRSIDRVVRGSVQRAAERDRRTPGRAARVLSVATGSASERHRQRAATMGAILKSTSTFAISAMAILTVMGLLGLPLGPLLASAGVGGVALGFGAQSLVKDLIGGFFLILENQVRVGDVVAINGTGGLVEAINLRTTVLRDEEGTVHIFPNGNINTLSNRSMQFSFYVVNLPLAYGEDVDAVTVLLKEVAGQMQTEDAYQPFMLAPLEVIGVDAFEENAVRLKVRIKTAPLKQWFIGREFRRRVNAELQKRGIQMYSPQRTLAVNSATPQRPTPK